MRNDDLKSRLRGVFTALVTPFTNGEVDLGAFRQTVRSQVDAGVAGIVPIGTTGEAATLSDTETDALISAAIEEAGGRCFVMAGAGSNNTAAAVAKAKRCEVLGADGVLVVTPYYNKPTQQGLIRHFSAVASAVNIPVILYSVPGRTGVEIAPETAQVLARKHENVVAIKEAGGRAERVTALRLALGDDFIIHSGDDALTLPFLSLGADGVISVASNLIPSEMVALVEAWHAGDAAMAKALHFRTVQLMEMLFVESNPAPVKAAMAMRGIISPELRAPLVELSPESMQLLRDSLTRFEAA